MLTFRFTGASGEMTEGELLTAGMEGKQVRLEFSEEWDGLRKAVVFVAGDRTCTIVDAEETETIPAQILSESLRRLYVGAYGLTDEGMVVIPAVYATGPFIHISAAGSGGDSGYVPEDPFWLEIEEELGKTLRFTPQALSDAEKQQARENIGALAPNPDAAQLLSTILQNGVYSTDQYINILHLSALLLEKQIYTVSTKLAHLTLDNKVSQYLEGASYQATLSPTAGYLLKSVTVTMGGEDITADVYANGIVSIPSLTGDVVISGTAVKRPLQFDQVSKGYVAYFSDRGMQIYATNTNLATALPVGQYLDAGKTYRFSLDSSISGYLYNVLVLNAAKQGLTFPYVANNVTYYDTAVALTYDSGWQNKELTYTVPSGNMILAVNFRLISGASMTSENYALLQSAFAVEVVEE